MFRTLTLSTALGLGLLAAGGVAPALAAGDNHVEDFDFSFEGPFGSYDQMQLQRGLQVYTEICSACHGLQFLSYRNLHDEGGPALPEDQVRAYAAQNEVWDPTLFDGEGDFRPATPADRFPMSNLSNAPDLTLMAKARAGFSGPYGTGLAQFFKGMGGAEYIASILTGYEEEPECALEGDPMDGYYNTAFAAGGFPDSCKYEDGTHKVPGSWIAMAPPLYGDDVDYADGHSTELEHVAEDVSAFLMWTAEPKLVARKQAGLTGVIFLALLSVLLYLTNKRLWAPVKHPEDH
ncbi:cytochrome c1 [Flavimaricola marinus]|uniref:Cytochrome c1 n=1 Tax=Flavimaricola marinus TaxID=1819565 RepID=A0A238LIZ8_9RHOB|nr:cytochrome c1 [Flavimaricola marinus]SMY09384.1 Cytochrome c1 precursor [Flavimaricola marinus]